MISLNVAFLKAAMLSTSTEQTRYYLRGVHMLRNADHLRITSTDGHRLFCAMQKLSFAGPDFDVILPTDGLKKAFTGLHKSTVEVELKLDHGEDRIRRATLHDVAMDTIDGTFPDITRVVPQVITGETAQYNPIYLADLSKQAKILGRTATGLHIGYNGGSPALVTFASTPDAFAVLMPYRATVDPLHPVAVREIMYQRQGAAEKAA
jgi:hypothetical protein